MKILFIPLLLAGEGRGEGGYNSDFSPSPLSSPLGERKESYFINKFLLT
jgi:hypothetical protein